MHIIMYSVFRGRIHESQNEKKIGIACKKVPINLMENFKIIIHILRNKSHLPSDSFDSSLSEFIKKK